MLWEELGLLMLIHPRGHRRGDGEPGWTGSADTTLFPPSVAAGADYEHFFHNKQSSQAGMKVNLTVSAVIK